MKGTNLINRFAEKILIWENGPFWVQKLRNSGSAGRIFLKFFTMKEANR